MKRKFTKLMAALALLTCLVPLTGWGQTKTDPTYKLTQVSTVSAGNKYVFVNDGYAVTTVSTTVNKKNLQSTNSYSTTGLQGNEEYVYELEAATNGYYLKNASSNQYLNNSSSTDMSMGSKSSIWSINITNNVALISNKSNNDRFLGDAGGTGNSQTHLYKAYATSNLSSHAHDFTVYLLEEETTDPTITLSETSLTGFNYAQGAGPSASQSFKVSGTNLGEGITVSLGENSNYEMSEQDGDNWSTIISNSIVLPATDGTVGEKTLYVRMKSGLTGSEINGTITALSEGATSKSISLSGSVTPTYTLTYSATNGNISGVLAGAQTAVETGAALVEGTAVTLTAEPSEGYRFVSWSDGGTNTLSSTTDNPTTFTMGTANVTVTATFEVIPTHTVTFSVNGTTTSNDFGEGAAIDFPSNPDDINGMSFVGWVSATISGTTNEAPSFVTSATMGTSNLTFYAVFAVATSNTPVETKAQTLQYDSWTYGGSTTNKTSYRLFHNGGYVESTAFDLSKLSKVIVYGGTYGGDQYNSLTIGDGTNVWKAVTVSGSNQTGVNTYTNGNALTGTKKLRVTSTCGSSNSSGVRMSKVEIYITAIPYAYYCTTVPAALPPVITVAENPFVISTTATITCATPEATIKYSFDNTNWENYSTALTITTATTIYAKALKGNGESTVSSVEVTKNLAEPTVTIDASGITNTNVFNGTDAGSLTATVTYNETPIEGATVTWSGNNDEAATIDASTGAVTLVAAGSVTFTATFEANSDYSEKTATYNMTVTNVDPNGAGTRSNPYTVADARTLIDDLSGGNSSTVYVSGIIYHVASFNSNKITYWISDNGQGNYNDYDGLQVYQGKGINGADFSAKADLEVGDQVIVKGVMSKYSGKYQFNSGNSLSLLVQSNNYSKAIEGYGENAGGYYLVASPVDIQAPTTAMTTGDYDLYYFDQAQTLEWRNYEADNGANHFNLAAGKGYLYANSANAVIAFTGTPSVTSATLAKTENVEFSGWNLVGNPLGTKAYINNRPFYIMNSEGTELIASTRNYIFPMEGVFVNANSNGEVLNFSATAPAVNPSKGNLNIQVAQDVTSRSTSRTTDRAVISFDEIGVLPKFMLNPNNTKLYIPQGGKDYAVVNAEARGEMPVNFKAAENGTYTISVDIENLDMDYLHLIDNMTGENVNLLITPNYTFEARTTDYASRFRLVFSANANENGNQDDNFAFMSDGNIVITNNGEATLQVIDMLGRIVSSQTVNGNASIDKMNANGVYVLRLINGNNVKTQKIVVK